MKRFDMYMSSLSTLVDHAQDPDAPFRPERLALHLNDQATRLYAQAQELRFYAYSMTDLAREIASTNAAQLEEYARHCTVEAIRLIDALNQERPRQQRPAAAALPYVPPAEEAQERLVRSRVTYSGDGQPHAHDLSDCRVGGMEVQYAGAPGTGRWVYRITRIDAEGAWGVLLEDTVRELDPSEVE